MVLETCDLSLGLNDAFDVLPVVTMNIGLLFRDGGEFPFFNDSGLLFRDGGECPFFNDSLTLCESKVYSLDC